MYKEIKPFNVVAAIVVGAIGIGLSSPASADSEAGMQAGTEAMTQNSHESSRQDSSMAATQNTHWGQTNSTTSAGSQNNSQANVEAGRPRNLNSENLQRTGSVGAGNNGTSNGGAMPKATEAPPPPVKGANNRSSAVKPKVATYNWNSHSTRSSKISTRRPTGSSRAYMVNTIQQAARTR